MKTLLTGPSLLLLLGSWGSFCAAGAGQSLIELSGGPVVTESAPSGAEAVIGLAAQYTWLRSPERPSTLAAVLRYRHGPFVAPAPVQWGPPEPGRACASFRDESEPPLAHFIEFGVGVRSSAASGLWFGEFEAGLAAIRYDREEGEAIREYGSPFAGLRVGTAWPPGSSVSGTATLAARVYPGVDHMAADASVGVAWAPWGAAVPRAPARD